MSHSPEQSPSPEDPELKVLLDEHAATMGARMEAALAEKDASLAATMASAAEQSVPTPEVSPSSENAEPTPAAVSGHAVHDRFPQQTNSDADNQKKLLKGRRRDNKSTKQRKGNGTVSVSPAVAAPVASTTASATVLSTDPAPDASDQAAFQKFADTAATQIAQAFVPDQGTGSDVLSTSDENVGSEKERQNEFIFLSAELSLPSPSHPESNEDRVLNIREAGVFGVFDGMGGYVGGEKAAQIAQSSIEKFVTKYGKKARSLEQAKDILKHAILAAHDDIMAAKAEDSTLQAMGTTATVGFMFEGKLIVGSVGDSRLYRARQGTLEQLSIDDSHIPEELRAKFNNVVNPAELDDYERAVWGTRNTITKALGTDSFQEPTIEVFDITEGDQYLFASDGLTDPITDNELNVALSSERASLQLLTEAAERARKGGERVFEDKGKGIKNTSRDKADDISFVLVKVENKKDVSDTSQPEVGSSGWTEARLLTEFPEGTQFVLQSKRGRSERTYERSGNGFVNTKNGKPATAADILELVNKNSWTFEEESAGPQLPGGLKKAEDIPVLEDVMVPGSGEKVRFVPLLLNEKAFYTGTHGPVIVERFQGGYRLSLPSGEVIGEGYDEEHIQSIATEESWVTIPVLTEVVKKHVEQEPGVLQPLKDGESAQYFVPELQAPYTLTKTAEGYTFTDGKKYTSPVYTEAEMAEIIRTALWRLVETPAVENSAEAEHIREEYQELFEGDIWMRKDEKGRVFKMHIDSLDLDVGIFSADVEYEVNGKFQSLGIMRISELRRRLFEGGYVREKQGKISEKNLVDARPPKALQEVPDDYIEDIKTPLEKRIEDLKALVDTQRMEYVSIDHKQNSAWSKIRRFLPGVSEVPGDADTTMKRESYELALQKLKNAQIEELKKEGLSEGDLRERMAKLLKFYEYDEQLSLMRDRDQVKIEQLAVKVEGNLLQKAGQEVTNKLHFLVATAEKVGQWYNKQSRLTKYAFAGLSLGAGVLGGAAVAMGLVALKKGLVTAGVAVTADTWLEGKGEAKRLAASKERGAADMKDLQEMQDYNEDYLAKLDTLLNERIATLDDRFKAQKRERLFNRSAAWGGAIGLMLGGQFIASHWGDIKKVLPNMTPKMPMKELTEDLTRLKTFEERVAAAEAEERAAEAASASASEPGAPASAAASVETTSTGGLLKEYAVTADDGKRGLWGVLDKQLPEGFTGNRNGAIATLEQTLKEKLAGKSPAELKALGFGPKGIGDIRPGSTILFDKLLTQEEIQSALENKTSVSEAVPPALDEAGRTVKVAEAHSSVPSASPEVTKVASVPGTPIQVTPLDEAANEQVFAKVDAKPMVPLDQVPDQTAAVREAVAQDQMRVATARPVEDPARLARLVDAKEFFKTYFEANPERIPQFHQTLGNMRQAMFLTPELMGDNQFAAKFDYTINRGTMGFANMARVMENAGRLQTGTLNEFMLTQEKNPLHPSQIRNLARLATVAQDPRVFGELGRVGRYETVDEYTRRIATLATALNKERTLVTLFSGRTDLLKAA